MGKNSHFSFPSKAKSNKMRNVSPRLSFADSPLSPYHYLETGFDKKKLCFISIFDLKYNFLLCNLAKRNTAFSFLIGVICVQSMRFAINQSRLQSRITKSFADLLIGLYKCLCRKLYTRKQQLTAQADPSAAFSTFTFDVFCQSPVNPLKNYLQSRVHVMWNLIVTFLSPRKRWRLRARRLCCRGCLRPRRPAITWRSS